VAVNLYKLRLDPKSGFAMNGPDSSKSKHEKQYAAYDVGVVLSNDASFRAQEEREAPLQSQVMGGVASRVNSVLAQSHVTNVPRDPPGFYDYGRLLEQLYA